MTISQVRAGATGLARDTLGIGGLCLIVAGLAQFSEGVAMIAAGGISTGLAVLWARRAG